MWLRKPPLWGGVKAESQLCWLEVEFGSLSLVMDKCRLDDMVGSLGRPLLAQTCRRMPPASYPIFNPKASLSLAARGA